MRKDQVYDVLRLFGSPFPGRSTYDAEWVSMKCPFAKWNHQGGIDNHPSFGANAPKDEDENSFYRCFTCGARGRLAHLGRDLSIARGERPGDPGYNAAVDQMLALEDEESGANLSIGDYMERQARKLLTISVADDGVRVLPEMAADRFTNDYPRDAEEYLVSRGVYVSVAQSMGLLWDAEDRRIIFPIRRPTGELAGFTGRSIDDRRFKIKDYDGLEKTKNILGIEHARTARGAFLVEGLFGWANVRQRAPDGWIALCTLGASVSQVQAKLLRDYLTGPVVVVYDNDKAGINGAIRAVRTLAEIGIHANVAEWPDGKIDPDQLTEADLAKMTARIAVAVNPFSKALTFRGITRKTV